MAVSHAALAASLPRLPADGRWTLGCLSEAQRPRPGLSPPRCLSLYLSRLLSPGPAFPFVCATLTAARF